jgi:hypothetical protein
MYYSNKKIEDFDYLIEHLRLERENNLALATNAYIDLNNYVFGEDSNTSFSNHNLGSRELNEKFNRLLHDLSRFEKNNPMSKQFRVLMIDLVDVKSSADEDLFRWSYYNHRFASSQGQDQRAMEEWHQLERKIDTNKIARFKARRENNLAHYMHIIRNHLFFDQIIFAGIDSQIKLETKYGLDIAEEQYLEKIIRENKAENVCSIVAFKHADPVLNILRKSISELKIKPKVSIVSTSKQLNVLRLKIIREIFSYLGLREVEVDSADLVILVNDIDELSLIPIVDSDAPIAAVDFSKPNVPNFAYLLLKDDGFEQIISYAKKRTNEQEVETIIRSISAALAYFVSRTRFTKQLALNYMDDYFIPLANSLGKSIEDFRVPIDLLTSKLH